MKIDDDSVYGLCNSLNATYGRFVRLAPNSEVGRYILRAQLMIMDLYEENKRLKGEKRDEN